ncbi:MAG: sodium-dependent transporter [Alphaproteobacteria bacterium]|nr:sodium-dependent transporter [Alphaproteobacteria bacterium]
MQKLFSSDKGFVFTMAGAAIGLGNIWRFPYLVANYGGGLFLLLYLVLLLSLGYFLLLGEVSFGKTTRQNVIDGTKELSEKTLTSNNSRWSKTVGIPPLVTAFMMNIIYLIVMGWILYYIIQNVLFLSDISTTPVTSKTFGELTNNFQKQLFWSFVCVLTASWIFIKGSLKHIEKIASLFIPAIFFILVYLIFWALSQDGAIDGIKNVFKPDWENFGFSEQGFNLRQFINVLFAALSQLLYSLSIGMGVAYFYGTRATKDTNMVVATRYVIVLDTLCSVLAAMFVLGISNAYNIPKDVGYNLSFVSLPIAFEQMIGGSFVMFLFYSVLYLAAYSSLVSHYMPLVTFAEEKFKISRGLAFTLIASANLILVACVLLAFSGAPENIQKTNGLFNITNVATDTMLLVSVFTMSLFIGWIGGKTIYNSFKEQFQKTLPNTQVEYMKTLFRFAAPTILMLIILNTLFSF